MYPGSLPYALPLLVIAGLTTAIALYAFRRSKRTSAYSFGWLVVAITEWVMAYALETIAPTLNTKIFADKLTYLGITVAPTLWLVFALHYTGRANWLTRTRQSLLIAWPLLAFGITLFNESNHLMWKGARLDPNGLPGLIFDGYGILFWVIVSISYILVAAGIILYLITYLRATRIFKQQIGIMLVGSIGPVIANAFFLTNEFQAQGIDWTPFAFGISGLLLAYGFFRFDLLNLMPIAAPLVIQNLRDAVIVINDEKRIVDINPIGMKWLGISGDVIGRDARDELKPIDIIWQYWDLEEAQVQLEIQDGDQRRWLHLMISSMHDERMRSSGHIIVASDKSHEHVLLEMEHRQTRQLELLNFITRVALETTDLRETMDILTSQLGHLLEADKASIAFWDDVQARTIPVATYDASNLETVHESNETILTKSVLDAGVPLVINDILNTPYLDQETAKQFHSRSILSIPLIANGQKLGAAFISFKEIHPFTLNEIDIGGQAAAQIALAIYKAQLLESSYRRVAQLGLLEEVSKSVAESLDEEVILERMVTAMVNRFGYAAAVISLLTEDNQLETSIIRGTEKIVFQPGYRQNIGVGIIGHVAETHQPYVTGDVTHDPYFITVGQRSGSALGVPMLQEGKLLGVLYVEKFAMNAFKQDDVHLLQTLTSHVVIALEKARLYTRAREHLLAMTILQSVSQTVASSLDLEEIFQKVIQHLKDTFGFEYISIYLPNGDVLRLGAQVGYPESLILFEIPTYSGIVGRTVQTKQTQVVRDVSKDPAFLRASDAIDSEICVPLLKEGDLLGVLNVEATREHPLKDDDVDLLIALAGPVAVAIDNARLHAEVKSLALTDGLTGLANRRAFDQVFETEVARATRYGYSLALIMADVDSFKAYNDTWGHPAGDERLKAIADIMAANARYPDIAARYGGEEFAIILPHTDKNGALALAERLRTATEASAPKPSLDGNPISGYTLSLGVAAIPQDGTIASTLVRAADLAELSAKRLGKNRVCAAGANSTNPSTKIKK